MSSQLPQPPDGNQNRTGPALYMTIVSTVLSCIFVGLRMYTRLFITKSARWDDWTICMALVFPLCLFLRLLWLTCMKLGTIVGMGIDFPEIHNGYGRHEYYLTDHQIQEFAKYGYGEWIQTFFTLMWTKVSICLLLLRISPNKMIRRPVQGVIVVLILSNVTLSLLYILQCIPVDAAWDKQKKKTAKCFSKGQVQRIIISQACMFRPNQKIVYSYVQQFKVRLTGHPVIAIISDFLLATFPIFILYTVQIKLRQKILLCALMGLGVITASCCIVRTVLNWQTVHFDQTWVGIDNFMWRAVEVNLGIACACIPTLLPLYRLLRDKIATLSSKQDSKSSIFSRLRRNLGPRTDDNTDRKHLSPYAGENGKSGEKKGFFKHEGSKDPITYPEQLKTGGATNRDILVETDTREDGQAMEMYGMKGRTQIHSRQSVDGSGEALDRAIRWEVENRV